MLEKSFLFFMVDLFSFDTIDNVNDFAARPTLTIVTC